MRFRNSPDEIFNRKDGSRTANYIGAHVLKHESSTICNGVDYQFLPNSLNKWEAHEESTNPSHSTQHLENLPKLPFLFCAIRIVLDSVMTRPALLFQNHVKFNGIPPDYNRINGRTNNKITTVEHAITQKPNTLCYMEVISAELLKM